MKIGTAIKAVRAELGVNQDELSERSGLSQTSISQIENGLKSPSQRSLDKICTALQVPQAVLYILAMDETDIPAGRKEAFAELYPRIRELAVQILGKRKGKLLQKKTATGR